MKYHKMKCPKCGREVKYVTKKPKLCAVCSKQDKPKKTSHRHRPPSRNTKGELALFDILNALIPDQYIYINHGFYSFLLSPKKWPMQLDRYYPELKLAFEHQGEQHEQYNKYIQGSKEKYEYYKQCDELKASLCKSLGVTLIYTDNEGKMTSESISEKIETINPTLWRKIKRG